MSLKALCLALSLTLCCAVASKAQSPSPYKEPQSPDGKVATEIDFKKISFTSTKDNSLIATLELATPMHVHEEIVWSNDSTKIFFSNRGGLHVFDIYKKKEQILPGLYPGLIKPSFSPDSKKFACIGSFPGPGRNANLLKVWDAESGAELGTLADDYGNRLLWSPDNKEIAAIDNEWKIKIVSVNNMSVLAEIKAERAGLPTLAYSPDSKYLAVANSMTGQTVIYEAASGAFVTAHSFPSSKVYELQWSADGKKLQGRGLQSRDWASWAVPYKSGTSEIVKTVQVERKARMKGYIPKNLEECFTQLDSELSADMARKILSGSEDGLALYHHGLGTYLRNSWGLWSGSRLYKYFSDMGLHHPDDMSAVILESYWRHKHNKPLELDKQIDKYKKYWEEVKASQQIEIARVKTAKAEITKRMMNLKLTGSQCQILPLKQRKVDGIRVRYLARLDDGSIFITTKDGRKVKGAYEANDFSIGCYIYSPATKSLKRVSARELDSIHGGIVIEGAIYLLGLKNNESILLKIDKQQRTEIRLPDEKCLSMLGYGFRQDKVVLVQPTAVYVLDGTKWNKLLSVSTILPKGALPPVLTAEKLYIRDEGHGENFKQLSWLDLATPGKVVSFAESTKLVGSAGPRWEHVNSFSVLPDGTVWFSVGEHLECVLRDSKDKGIEIATFCNQLQFGDELIGRGSQSDVSHSEEFAITCVNALSRDKVRGIGPSGMFLIDNGTITPELRFKNTAQIIPTKYGRLHYHWTPTHMLELGKDRYFIGAHWGGCYILEKDKDGKWSLDSIDDCLPGKGSI